MFLLAFKFLLLHHNANNAVSIELSMLSSQNVMKLSWHKQYCEVEALSWSFSQLKLFFCFFFVPRDNQILYFPYHNTGNLSIQ